MHPSTLTPVLPKLTLGVQQEGEGGHLIPGHGPLLHVPIQASLCPGLGESPKGRERSDFLGNPLLWLSPFQNPLPRNTHLLASSLSTQDSGWGIQPGGAAPPPSPYPIRLPSVLLSPLLPTHYQKSTNRRVPASHLREERSHLSDVHSGRPRSR